MMNQRFLKAAAGWTATVLLLATVSGCGLYAAQTAETSDETAAAKETETVVANDSLTLTNVSLTSDEPYEALTASYTVAEEGAASENVQFTERDLTQNADLSEAKVITAQNDSTVTITEEGMYYLTGTATNFTVRVEAEDEAKIQLCLCGLNVTNDDFPVIYVLSADKVFITTEVESENTLTVTGAFRADGSTNTDAVIFSRDDLVLNGHGTLTVISNAGNGITTKDDLKITGGTYVLKTKLDALEANDSIAVSDGTFDIETYKDGLHSENEDDDSLGWIWIGGGTWTINAKADGIQATSWLQIDGGLITVTASEGLEATYVIINGGTVTITGSDDGINASRKSSAYTPTVEINGGTLTVTVGQGDTDAIDSNGSIIVTGGTIDITSTVSSFDYDGTATYTGGTIIINGEQVDSIPESAMFGPGGGFGGQGGFGGFGGGPGGRR